MKEKFENGGGFFFAEEEVSEHGPIEIKTIDDVPKVSIKGLLVVSELCKGP